MPSRKKEEKKSKEPISVAFTNWVWSEKSLIAHTIFFIGSFSMVIFWFKLNDILLVLTTVVSLEAIYLAIFIQITVNRNTQSLQSVEEDIDEIQEDIEEIQEDVDEIEKDIDEIQEDIDEIQEDVEEIQEDVEEIQEEEDESEIDKTSLYYEKIESQLNELIKEINELKKNKKK